MRPLISPAQALLVRALTRLFEQCDLGVTIDDLASEPWASVTFSGHRHRLDLLVRPAGPGEVEALDRRLSSSELTLPGFFVADVALVSQRSDPDRGGMRLSLEMLVIEE